MKTRWNKLNSLIDGGIEWGNFYTLAGISGSGKSAFTNILETDLFDLNKPLNKPFNVLSFNFEMSAYRQILRKLSAKIQKTVSELKNNPSSNGVLLTDDDLKRIKKEAYEIEKYNIYYVDIPGSVSQIGNTIINFSQSHPDSNILVILDHARLAKRIITGQGEQQMLDSLGATLLEVIKRIPERCSVILLSQLNREIEKRISYPNEHYPIRSDLFGADSIYQYSDYVFV
ncbi:MAG: DnaB-like helicase C-terminal domain-containing protein, partial [Nanoarchaeota archaeon]